MLRKILMQLLLHAGIGPALVARICATSGLDELLLLKDLSAGDIVQRYGVSPRQAHMITQALADGDGVGRHDEWCRRNGVRVVTLLDPDYPFLLAQIGAPPVAIWVKGVLAPAAQQSCALVGSRNATHYGKRVVDMIVPELVRHGIATVSGGARGIDGWVHAGTIDAGGHTTVVMGCGFEHTYPPEHGPLFNRVVESGGCLVSPFAPSVRPLPGTFPARNRIIAGLSSACIVVQAAQKSGALITAAQALEENREVAAVPGPIDDALSVGPHELISNGARMVHNAESALALFGLRIKTAEALKAAASLSSDALTVLKWLERPLFFDDLLEQYTGAAHQLQSVLFELEMAGACKQNHAGMWVRCG